MKMKKLLCVVIALCLLISLSVCMASCRKAEPDPTQTEATQEANPMSYTVEVKTEGGMPLEGIGVYVYTDDTQEELVWFAKTDSEGKITFNDVESDSFIAVLAGVPEGYEYEETYAVTENTVIQVGGEISGELDLEQVFKLGDMMKDFTVTTPEGTEYTLSQLLETKKAVVLNFWYCQCQPCRNEFPYLQEAYEIYGDKLEILALNPVNTDDAEIAQFRDELGLTFPMAKVDPAWEKAMEITAYPTTVVIDRFGTITMIHKGSVTDAQPFFNMFDFFTKDEYETQVVEKLEDLPEVSQEDLAIYDNPTELGGVTSFKVTVKAGEVWYLDLYKIQNLYFQITSPNVYVVYNGLAYYPNGGSVGLILNAPDTFTPVRIGIGNSGKKTETFTATLGQFKGTQGNPYDLTMGEFSVDVSYNNDQGVYFVYTAPADGELKMTCLRATAGIEYDYTLYNLNSYAFRTKGTDFQTDEEGHPVVTVKAKKGQKIQFSVGTLPNASNDYPAGSFNFLAEFDEGVEVEDEEQVKLVNYSITVTDENRKPMPNVFFSVTTDKEIRFATNENGVATVKLPAGTYEAKLVLPQGYEAYTTTYLLTEALPSFSVKLDCVIVVEKTYTVKILDPSGQPVANAMVAVGTQFGYTDENGTISFTLPEGEYTAMILPPAGYTADSTSYNFGDGMTEIAVVVRPAAATEPTVPSDSTAPTTPSTPSESTNPTDPSDSTNPTDPSDSTKPTDPSDSTDPTTPSDPTVPTEPAAPAYSVKVTDYNGNPKTGVVVQFLKDDAMVAMVPVDTNGVAAPDLTEGTYTVKLLFSGEELYYEEKLAVLTKDVPAITLKLAPPRGEEFENLSVGKAYYVSPGGAYVTIQSDVVNYFMFEPTVAGQYKVTTSDPEAKVSYWGGNKFFIQDNTDNVGLKDNAYILNVKESNIGVTHILGITGTNDCILEIIRIGDPVLGEEDMPYTEYKGTTPVTPFTYTGTGTEKSYIDILGKDTKVNLVFNSADGYYHLDSNNGPVVYMDLTASAPYIPLHGIVGLGGVGGENVAHFVYDDNGVLIRKEQFNTLLQTYAANADEKLGVYPLTEDLIYMIQKGGERKGWWDKTSPNFMFKDYPTVNTELAWMFACCTIE